MSYLYKRNRIKIKCILLKYYLKWPILAKGKGFS